MKKLLRIALAGLLALSWMTVCRAVTPVPWEALLDRYELICWKCLEARKLREGGAEVPAAQLRELLDELEELRSQLKGATDRMPAAARRRFDTIRRMYASGVWTDTHPRSLADPQIRFDTPRLAAPPYGLVPPASGSRPVRAFVPVRARWTVSASAVVTPEPAWGTLAACCGRRWGGFLAFRSSFAFHDTAYDALSDGSAGDTRIWTSGRSASDRIFLTAGPVWSLTEHLSLYGGAGWGLRRLCWEDSDGEWIRITDASRSGLCTEIGAALHFSRISLSLSHLALPPTYGALTVGLGWSF